MDVCDVITYHLCSYISSLNISYLITFIITLSYAGVPGRRAQAEAGKGEDEAAEGGDGSGKGEAPAGGGNEGEAAGAAEAAGRDGDRQG